MEDSIKGKKASELKYFSNFRDCHIIPKILSIVMVSSPIYKLKKFLVPLADFQLNHFLSTTLECFKKAESLLDANMAKSFVRPLLMLILKRASYNVAGLVTD